MTETLIEKQTAFLNTLNKVQQQLEQTEAPRYADEIIAASKKHQALFAEIQNLLVSISFTTSSAMFSKTSPEDMRALMENSMKVVDLGLIMLKEVPGLYASYKAGVSAELKAQNLLDDAELRDALIQGKHVNLLDLIMPDAESPNWRPKSGAPKNPTP